ncbi:M15 family metallopeptidase [Aeromonas media]|jgi:LAS superfamily LD-carboxypeptidase LdcB|uniref:D-alanyl-D-alanine carboxypeptidase family protein n=1 Tax=Aeromonas media TaxID=651 RepID=A0AAE7AM88_AERME|nr:MULTISPECIES: M15 family metallopeptidase [Aeromonas]MBP8112464.1 M15 family metallopeptidase [Aeromonas sp.]MBP9677768.1 M15 family metallopeptidase [Aeromonas sp.]QJT31398.1 D-alanyl-D-alanine carboxypeptidase family protein [Aeromonas media]WED80267.1 M15 family metallopeptidase [Aeromonas media]WOQ12113.1 M15 family metallopeptidase [Aeromonas media]
MTQDQLLGLDESHLILVGRGPHRLTAATAAAFNDMQVAAAYEGFNLQAASSWRSFERQLAIWNGKWRGERPLLDADNQPLDALQLDDMERLHAILRWSALPGTSRHHWGTDLDIYDPDCLPVGTRLALEPWEYEAGGWFADLGEWLGDHMADFGFFLPYAKPLDAAQGVAYEPWHISFAPESGEQRLDPDALALCLQQADIEGKECILAHLDEILARYVTAGHTERRI